MTLERSLDQALVLSDWLHRVMGTAVFDGLVNEDRAVWSPLYQIAGTLETSLVEVFAPDYRTRLDGRKGLPAGMASPDRCCRARRSRSETEFGLIQRSSRVVGRCSASVSWRR